MKVIREIHENVLYVGKRRKLISKKKTIEVLVLQDRTFT